MDIADFFLSSTCYVQCFFFFRLCFFLPLLLHKRQKKMKTALQWTRQFASRKWTAYFTRRCFSLIHDQVLEGRFCSAIILQVKRIWQCWNAEQTPSSLPPDGNAQLLQPLRSSRRRVMVNKLVLLIIYHWLSSKVDPHWALHNCEVVQSKLTAPTIKTDRGHLTRITESRWLFTFTEKF